MCPTDGDRTRSTRHGSGHRHRHRPSLPANLPGPSSYAHTHHRSLSINDNDNSIGNEDGFSIWRGRKIRNDIGSWPCDTIELERQEAQHWLLRICFPYLGPVEQVLGRPNARVLDIATGTGIWAIEMADMFPQAEVTGVDTVPTQPKYVPPNCEFELADLNELPYEPGTFDLIHIRFAHSRVRSFPSVITKAFTLLRPDGLLLLFDYDLVPILADETTPRDAQAWHNAFSKSMRKAGMSIFSLDKVLPCLAGREVDGKDMRVPIGHGEGRMGQLGKIHYINTKAFLEAARHVMVVYGEYTDPEVDVLSEAYMAEVDKGQLYTRYHALSVRKEIRGLEASSDSRLAS